VVAAGHAATHWTAGGIDVAAPSGVATAREGVEHLSAVTGHPYSFLGPAVEPGLAFLRGVLAEEGLAYDGELGDPLRSMPTAIGGTRRASILPAGQAAALRPWIDGERLLIVGPRGFKDYWPQAIAASLSRPGPWGAADRPAGVEAVVVDWPGLQDRRNLSGPELARHFDDPAWRAAALDVTAGAVRRQGSGPVRVALPAVLGLGDHAAAFADASDALGGAVFEVPLIAPSVPGLRLFRALRAALRRRGGRLVVGEPVRRVVVEGDRLVGVVMSAAVRARTIRTGALVLATGGIAGGGLVGRPDGTLEEPVLGLPVEAPPAGSWFAEGPLDVRGHPLEAAGIRTDVRLRPVRADGQVVLAGVAVVGSLLAGQRYLSERCGDGVAIASGWRAAQRLGAAGASASAPSVRTGAA
jgi:glycerol-3-phosphate dehydrogenase subunit B